MRFASQRDEPTCADQWDGVRIRFDVVLQAAPQTEPFFGNARPLHEKAVRRIWRASGAVTRVAWITPDYPPDRGGVSDHSAAMTNALREQGHEVRVHSHPHRDGFDELNKNLDSFRPDAIVVAYTPLGFAPRTGGISPAFARWCTGIQNRKNVSSLLLAHEVSLPVSAHWQRRELKLALLGAAQVAQFEILARCFDAVAFSNEGTREFWAKRLPLLGEKLHTLRICSNIPLVSSSDPRAELERAGYSLARRTLVFFGSGHPSILFDYVEAALAQLAKVAPDVELVVLGMNAEKLISMQPSISRLEARVQALGYVPARAVSLWLQVAELVLAPLSEGVNARKGTVMAAFQHGRAVATTRGIHTRNDIDWDSICALAPLEPDAFATMVVECFQDPVRRERLGRAAKAEYQQHASAPVTASELVRRITVQARRPTTL